MNKTYKPIAMWSGPRNISTAMMRSFENRADCKVIDEPLYGYYLKATAFEHPGSKMIIDTMDSNWQTVTEQLTQPLALNQLYYQKHMTQHILPEMDLGFIDKLTNCFLIREPFKIIRSYAKVREQFSIDELGFKQQLAIFNRVTQQLKQSPIVIDSDKLLENPRAMLVKLCERLEIAFSESMLSWPKGKRDSDGCWAPYWYKRVEQSTGFEKPVNENPVDENHNCQEQCKSQLTQQQHGILEQAQTIYQTLKAYEL